jgi:hypothetical protein
MQRAGHGPFAPRSRKTTDFSVDLFCQRPQRAEYEECPVKSTKYFEFIRRRPDRALIQDTWIERVIHRPVKETVQKDGRIRRWAPIKEMENRFLRVVLLADRETVHNAFFDRRFTL